VIDGGICQVAMTVRDLAAQRRFYQDVLGLPFLFETNGMVFFQCGGVRLMLGQERDGAPAVGNSLVYFQVADLDACHARLQAAGVRLRSAPHALTPTLWMFELEDPEGNFLGVQSVRSAAG
jgi:predicted enzyme related to lactoylglutathione lyase